jgi:flagellar biosynthetic protein FliR
MDFAAFSAAQFWAFLQIFARVSALFISAPVFGAREIPAMVKVGLSAILSLVLLPIVGATLDHVVPSTLYAMVGNLVGQVLIGLLIGLIVSLLFAAVRVGGDVLDYQMGFTQATTFNPQFNETVSPIANFQYQYAIVLYLIANGHWLLLASLERSFVKLPVGQLVFSGVTVGAFTDLTYQMLVAGLQIAAPGAAVLLITDIAFAFLNRALPQMQVFYLGMPVKVMVGLAVVIAIIPSLTFVVGQMVTASPDDIYILLRGMHR